MRTYRVEVRRGNRYWVLSVPDIPAAYSQARRLRDVEATARDLIAVMLEVSVDSFDLDVHITMPAEVQRHVERAAHLRAVSAQAQTGAAAESRAAARALHDRGVPLRDVGQVLGVSYRRAHQLVS